MSDTELNADFSQRGIGSIPPDWAASRIDDLFTIQQGKSLSQKTREGISQRPFLRTANVLWGKINLDRVDQMHFDTDEALKLALRSGDLLVCEGGDIGRTAIWDGELSGCLYQNHLHRLRRKTDAVEPRFFMYWMQAAYVLLGLYGGAGNKTTIPNLPASRLKQFLVPVPPLPEQRAIAAVLTKLQQAVELQEKTVATLKELKAATMAKLFREGLRGERLKQTEIGEIPESWEVVKLGDVTTLVSGGTPSKARPEWWSGTIPWVSPKDLKRDRLHDVEDHVTQEAIDDGSRLVPAKSIFIVIRGMILVKDVPIAITEVPMAFNQDMKAILPGDRIDPDYTLYAMKARKDALWKEIGTSAHGTRRMGTSTIHDFLIPLPKPTEQREIARAMRLIDERVEIAKQKKEQHEHLFASTLHQLMTGQVRVTGIVDAEGNVKVGGGE